MTAQHPPAEAAASRSRLLRIAIQVTIGALVLAALVCVVWVVVGAQSDLLALAALTIVLFAGFAGISILEVRLSARRPVWFSLTSTGVWVATLFIGVFMIWAPGDAWYLPLRVIAYLTIVLVLQLAVLHVRLYGKAYERRPTTFTAIVTYITVGLVAILVFMLVLALMLYEWIDFHDLYWRWVVAIAILAALGTALVPLVNVLFTAREDRPQKLLPWPTYADGRTPLPALPDGQPDFQAYTTGRPTYPPRPPMPPVPPQQG